MNSDYSDCFLKGLHNGHNVNTCGPLHFLLIENTSDGDRFTVRCAIYEYDQEKPLLYITRKGQTRLGVKGSGTCVCLSTMFLILMSTLDISLVSHWCL